MPSPSASRSNVRRLALGTAAPAFFMYRRTNQALIPLPSSGRSVGAFVSATRTSPLGSTYSHRGWSRFRAYAVTTRPAAATGLASSDQPTASATLTVGMSDVRGVGSSGVGPVPAETGSRADEPHAVATKASVAVRHRPQLLRRQPTDSNSCITSLPPPTPPSTTGLPHAPPPLARIGSGVRGVPVHSRAN